VFFVTEFTISGLFSLRGTELQQTIMQMCQDVRFHFIGMQRLDCLTPC